MTRSVRTEALLTNLAEGRQDASSTRSLPEIELPVDWFDQRSGLKSGQIHETVIDGKGRVWASTPCGLVRYDGSKMHVFSATEGLNCSGLRAVAFDKAGQIWVGSDAGLDIYEIDGDRLLAVQSMPIGMVDCIAIGEAESWIGTPAGLLHWDATKGLSPVEFEPLRTSTITSTLLSPAGILWVAGPELGIARFDGENWRHCEHDQWNALGCPTKLAMGPEEAVLFAGSRGLAMLDACGTLHGLATTDGPVSAVFFADGLIWAGVGESLFRYRPTPNLFTPVDSIFRGARLNHMMADGTGNIWIATDNKGIVRVSCLRRILTAPTVADVGAVLCIKPTADGVFIGGTNGAIAPDGRVLLTGVKVWDIACDDNSIFWAATENGLQCLANPTLAIPFVHRSPTFSAPCRVLHRSGGSLYVGSVRGLARMSPSGLEEIRTPDSQLLGYVYTLFEDAAGTIWIGTLGNGLWRLTDGIVARVNDAVIGKSANVMSICQQKNGDIFVAHNQCISRIDEQKVASTIYKSSDAVSAWAIACFNDNTLFAGTSSCLKLIDLETGVVSRKVASARYNGGWEFTTSRAMTRLADGSLLCGTSDGLRCVHLGELDRLSGVPEVHLANVKWSGVKPSLQADTIRVAPGKWRVEFHVWTNWSVDEPVCNMQYRLLGFDSDWSSAQPISNISFNSLPPGQYALEVRINSPLCGVGNSTLLYRFHVGTVWNALASTVSIWLSSGLGSCAVALQAKNWVIAKKKRRFEQIFGERMAELAAINGQLRASQDRFEMMAYTDPLTGISNRRSFDIALAKELEYNRTSGKPLSLILFDLDHFKLYNDTYGHNVGDECLNRVASVLITEIRKPGDLSARIGGEEFAVLLPDTNCSEAAVVTERILAAIRKLQIPHIKSSVAGYVTASAGLTTCAGDAQVMPADMLSDADEQLYRAKATGKDRWCAALARETITKAY